MRSGGAPRGRCRSWVSGGAGSPARGLCTMLLERAAQLGPLPGVVYLTVHTLGPQGVTQPCSPHSSSAMQPVAPFPPLAPQAETAPVLGGGQQQPRGDALRPPRPQPFAALSAFVSEHLSNVVSATTTLCLSLFWPQPSSRKVPVCFCFSLLVCLSLGSLSGDQVWG